MKKPWNLSWSFSSSFAALILLGILATLPLTGCSRGRHTSDARLRQIDEALDSQLPTGTSRSRVSIYLSAQGFPIESAKDPHDLVAIVHRVDTETLRPVTARVTFHFDASGNLKSYDLVDAPGSASQQ
jgi:hypothetical protein